MSTSDESVDPVRDPDTSAVQRLIEEIDDAHDLRFELRERCRGGLNGGAWLLADAEGRAAVVKWRADHPTARTARLAEVVDRLRADGYPTPRWIAAGVTDAGTSYHVQEFVPGEPASTRRSGIAAMLIEVIERQAGVDPDPAQDWSGYVTRAALDDGDDSARAHLRRLGEPGRSLIDHMDRVRVPRQGDAGRNSVSGAAIRCVVVLARPQAADLVLRLAAHPLRTPNSIPTPP